MEGQLPAAICSGTGCVIGSFITQILGDNTNGRRVVSQQQRGNLLGNIDEQCKKYPPSSVMLEWTGKETLLITVHVTIMGPYVIPGQSECLNTYRFGIPKCRCLTVTVSAQLSLDNTTVFSLNIYLQCGNISGKFLLTL